MQCGPSDRVNQCNNSVPFYASAVRGCASIIKNASVLFFVGGTIGHDFITSCYLSLACHHFFLCACLLWLKLHGEDDEVL